jgi:predicted GNAT family acetyltransferase
VEVQHDEKGGRFFISLPEGGEAVLSYSREGDLLDFYSTYVPPALRNKGLAEAVVEAGFLYAKTNGLKVTPSCSYVASFVRRRKEFLPLVV